MLPNKTLKRVLIYGDSYTYGKIPNGARYDAETRFTGIVQKLLLDTVEIIEEGLRGRTIAGENSFFPHRDGLKQFDGIIGSHLPLDLIIFFLGANDTNSGSIKNPQAIVMEYQAYLTKLAWWATHLGLPVPKIAILAPPIIDEEKSYAPFKDIFKGSQQKSQALPALLEHFSMTNKLEYLDVSKIMSVSPEDGIHLSLESNRVLGGKLAEFISDII